jgi:hypothetical protein
VPLALALEQASVSFSGWSGTMRAADHQFQQPLVVGVMDRQGSPGVKFDVEGSGYGFRVVRRPVPHLVRRPRWKCPHSCKMTVFSFSAPLDTAPDNSPMRTTVLNLEESKIREVANAGMGRSDVLAFWFGESDEVTPDFIRQAAIESLQAGETFYSHNLGLPELREAIAGLHSKLHGPVGAERIAVTSGGVNALMLAVQAVVDAGDEVVAVTPVWPNLTAQAQIMGAKLKRCRCSRKAAPGSWTCRPCWRPSRRPRAC